MSVIFPGLEEYNEPSFSFRGSGQYGIAETPSSDEELLDKFDMTDAVQVMVDVTKFNRKLGLIKDGATVINSLFHPTKDQFPVDTVRISMDEFANDICVSHVISIGRFETLYSDFARYVRTYFQHSGTSSLFENASEYRINNDVFDKQELIDVLSGRHNNPDTGVYMTSISGSVQLSNVNNLLRMACYTNAFNNRDNLLNSDGFMSGDLIFIPNGIQFQLNVDVGFSQKLHNSKDILRQLQKALNTTGGENTIAKLTPSSITKTTVAPLVLRLSNFPEETADNYVLPRTDINTGDYKWINRGHAYGCRKWTSIALSSTGMNQLVGEYDGYLYRSGDYGTTWEQCIVTERLWSSLAVSDTGQYQSATAYNSFVYISNDYGGTWSASPGASEQKWSAIAISSTGKYQTATVMDGNIWTSHNYGVSWSNAGITKRWKSVAMSFTGQRQTAVSFGECIYISNDYGLGWVMANPLHADWASIALSASAQYQLACVAKGLVYSSTDFGVSWVPTRLEQMNWSCVAMCGTGQYQTAVSRNGDIYVSKDYGVVWANSTRRQTIPVTHLEEFGVKPADIQKFDYSASINTKSTKAYIGVKTKAWTSVAVSFGGNIQSSIAWDGSIYMSKMF